MIRAGLILLVVVLPLSVVRAEAQSANAAPPTAADRTRHYHQTYREGFQPPAEATAEARRMHELIDKINRTALPDYRREPMRPLSSPAVSKSPDPPEPAATQPAAPSPASPPKILSNRTLRELARRVPESVADPIRLGDALYRSGHIPQALFIYRSALEKTREPEDELWLYYQMGCCLKETEPAEARKYYQQVRTSAPDSPWSELADIQLQLVDWIERNQPTQFLEDLHRDLHPQDERIEESRRARSRTGEEKQLTGSGASGSAPRIPASRPAAEGKGNTPASAEPDFQEPPAVSKALNES